MTPAMARMRTRWKLAKKQEKKIASAEWRSLNKLAKRRRAHEEMERRAVRVRATWRCTQWQTAGGVPLLHSVSIGQEVTRQCAQKFKAVDTLAEREQRVSMAQAAARRHLSTREGSRPRITLGGFLRAMARMRNGKSPGVDGLTVEILKAATWGMNE